MTEVAVRMMIKIIPSKLKTTIITQDDISGLKVVLSCDCQPHTTKPYLGLRQSTWVDKRSPKYTIRQPIERPVFSTDCQSHRTLSRLTLGRVLVTNVILGCWTMWQVPSIPASKGYL